MEQENIVLKIENLTKKYPTAKTPSLADFSLTVYAGEIVGLLGHNGAGKSTTLKCLTGMIPYSSGSILVNGFDITKEPVKAKSTFGFVSDKHDVFVKMTGMQYINFMADAYGVSKEDRKTRLENLDKVFELKERLYDTISDYSHGMRQKVCMMGSLIHSPKLWIMDEPMIGLDPMTSARVIEFMKEYVKGGNAILFSSHNINSVQKICDRAVIIKNGLKKEDFYISEFLESHPNADLEEIFFSNTKVEDETTTNEVENIEEQNEN